MYQKRAEVSQRNLTVGESGLCLWERRAIYINFRAGLFLKREILMLRRADSSGLFFLLTACLAVYSTAVTASGSIVLDTNATSGWTVTRTTSSAAPGTQDYLSMPYDGAPTTVNAVVTSLDPNWTAQNDPRLSSAKWISNNANAVGDQGDPFSTRYVYQTNFVITQPSVVTFTFGADNLVDNIVLSTAAGGGGTILGTFTNTLLPIGDQTPTFGRASGFLLAGVQSFSATLSGTVFITATTYNYGGPPIPGHFVNGSSHGFILAADASPVPEPAAISILALPITGLLLRRRRSEA